jgi:hypothetical protein
MNGKECAVALVAIWLAPALGIWLSGSGSVGWAWFLSVWATELVIDGGK